MGTFEMYCFDTLIIKSNMFSVKKNLFVKFIFQYLIFAMANAYANANASYQIDM